MTRAMARRANGRRTAVQALELARHTYREASIRTRYAPGPDSTAAYHTAERELSAAYALAERSRRQ